MDSNTHSAQPPAGRPANPPDPHPDTQTDGAAGLAGLAGLAATLAELAAHHPGGLSDSARADRVLGLRRLVDRLEGHWLHELADLDARGAAGADRGQPAPTTASWLRNRLRLGAGAAHSAVRTARALFGGPLPQTAAALMAGAISPAHARVVADGTHQLPTTVTVAADPVLVEAAGRLDPPQLRQAVGWLVQVADPDAADRQAEHRHARRGLWLSPTWEGLVAVDGLLEPEAGTTLLAALEPLARPADAEDGRSGGQRTADALTELARRALEGGQLPQTGGVRPQLLVTVDLDSLLGHPGTLGGELGGAGGAGGVGPLDPEGCRRLACDGALTRVLVTRQHPTDHDPDNPTGDHDPSAEHDPGIGHDASGGHNASGGHDTGDHQASNDDPADGHSADPGLADPDPSEPVGLPARLRAAMALLPPVLGGAPSQPLDLGRTTRVVHPAQRHALAVRDGGCVFPGCERPLAWCEAHHLRHWLKGGPTDLSNLALVCRAHHRAVHEQGWQLTRGPDGHVTASPTDRRHHPVP